MNFSIDKYELNGFTISKIIGDHYWIMVYDNNNKTIITKPTEVFSAETQTINRFCIKDTESECWEFAKKLNLSSTTESINYSGVTN